MQNLVEHAKLTKSSTNATTDGYLRETGSVSNDQLAAATQRGIRAGGLPVTGDSERQRHEKPV
jgi:hypothetical protein